MSVEVADTIERELILPVPRGAVWAALTTAEGLASWWSRGASVDLQLGGEIALEFGSEHGDHQCTIVALEPERLFAVTWQPFQSEPDASAAVDLTTRVEFRLEDHPEGTRLSLRESGFAALPGTLGDRTFAGNRHGWDVDVLPRLRAHLEGGAG